MSGDQHREGGGYGYDGGAPSGSALAPVSRWVRVAGAATSLALLVGVVVWGYKLAVRDVSGVPVIRAIEGPSRIAPEDPGGELASHVGLAVNQVAGTGSAAPGPDQVMLAPDPQDITDEDMTMAAVGPLPDPAAPARPALPAAAAPTPVPDSRAGAGAAPAEAPAPDEAVPEGQEAEAEPGEAPAETAEDTGEDAAAPIVVIPTTVPGVAHSPRPMARPETDLAAEAAAAAVARAMGGEPEAGGGTEEVDPSTLPEGTRLAQIGAFETPDLARAEWDRVAERFGALMEGKRRVIQQAASGGRTFYRLRVEGFADVDEARRFCAALVAEQTNCIPTLVR